MEEKTPETKPNPSPEVTQTPAPKRRKPAYKRWWFWFLMGLATVTTIIIIVVAASGGSSNNGSSSNQTSQPAVQYKMNDTVTVNEIEYTILSGYNTKEVSIYVDDGKTTQNFAVLSIKMKNTGSVEKSVIEDYMLFYRGTDQYKPSSKGIYLDDGFWYSVTLGPKIEKTVKVVYEIPSEYQSTDYIQFNYGFSSVNVYLQ